MRPCLPFLLALLMLLGGSARAACPALPLPDCRTAAKSRLALTVSKAGTRDKLGFHWSKGAATSVADFGAPDVSADYAVCLYGSSHGDLLAEATIPAGDAGWRATRTGFKYGDRAAPHGGIRKIDLRAGAEGKAKIKVSGRGIDLADGALPVDPPVRFQLMNLESETCWQDTYGGSEIRRTSDLKLRGKGAPEDPNAMLPVLRTPDPLPGLSAADAGVPDFFGTPVVAKVITATMIPAHPILDNDGDARIHNDVYNSAVYDRPGPLGSSTSIASVDLLPDHANPLGHVCATLAFHDGYVLGACIQASVIPFGAATNLVMLDPTSLDVLAEVEVAPRPLVQNSAGGAYFSVDQQGQLIIGPASNAVETWAVEVHGGTPYFVRRGSLDVSGELPANDLLQDTVIDWEGRYWFLAISGVIGYVDPDTGAVETFDTGEGLQNSMAVDATGVYVVTFEALYKFTVAANGSIEEAWRVAYDAGTQQLQSPGSGTTPTLFGEQDDLIGICDNADTRVNMVIRDRTNGTEVCTVPLFRDDESACENTLIGHGDEAVIVNNAGYLGAFEVQNVVRPGIEKHRVRADRSGCDPAWINQASIGNSAQLSTTTGLIYGWGADPNAPALDAYYFTANDWETGEEAFRIYTGNDTPWNPANGQPHLSPEGAAYIGTLHGIVRIAD